METNLVSSSLERNPFAAWLNEKAEGNYYFYNTQIVRRESLTLYKTAEASTDGVFVEQAKKQRYEYNGEALPDGLVVIDILWQAPEALRDFWKAVNEQKSLI